MNLLEINRDFKHNLFEFRQEDILRINNVLNADSEFLAK